MHTKGSKLTPLFILLNISFDVDPYSEFCLMNIFLPSEDDRLGLCSTCIIKV